MMRENLLSGFITFAHIIQHSALHAEIFCRLLIFFDFFFFNFLEFSLESNNSDPDKPQHFVNFDLGPNYQQLREPSGSVVECLTRDRLAGGSSLTGITALCP